MKRIPRTFDPSSRLPRIGVWRRTVHLAAVVLMVAALLPFGGVGPVPEADAASIAIGQTYYVPMPVNDFLGSLYGIGNNTVFGPTSETFCCNGQPGDTVKTVASIVVGADGTDFVIDHWEDGYDVNPLGAPGPRTESFSANSGDVFTFDQNIPYVGASGPPFAVRVPAVGERDGTNFYVDGRDKIVSTNQMAVTFGGWASRPGPFHAGMVAVYDTDKMGQTFVVPVGQDANVNNLFDYVGGFIVAAENATTVDIDADANGTFETTVTLNEGGTHFINGGLMLGAEITSDKPVAVYLATGDRSATYEGRYVDLFPTSLWFGSYYTPVGSPSASESTPLPTTHVYLFNGGTADITVTPTTSGGPQTPIVVAAGTRYDYTVPVDSGVRFDGSDQFYAISAFDAGSGTSNSRHDWGFTLIPAQSLTPMAVVPYGPGSEDRGTSCGDTSGPDGKPDCNYSGVWVTAAAATTLSVSFDGDLTAEFSCSVAALESVVIYDDGTDTCTEPGIAPPHVGGDNDMTGARVWSSDGAALAVAWGQGPFETGRPAIDLGTAILPYPSLSLVKSGVVSSDTDGDGNLDPGDTVSYAIIAVNNGLVSLGSIVVDDETPANTSYVAGSTTYETYDNAGALISGPTSIPDDGVGTTSPLDEGGTTLPALAGGQTHIVRVSYLVDDPVPFGVSSISNDVTFFTDQGTFSDREIVDLDVPPLQVQKTSAPDTTPVLSGDTIRYTIRVANNDDLAQTNVAVNDVIDAGLTTFATFVGADVNGISVAVNGAPPDFVLPSDNITLLPGRILTVVYDVTVNAPLPVGTTSIVNEATGTSTQQPTGHEDSVEDPVEMRADLSIAKTDAFDPVEEGTLVDYTVTVTNNGPDIAENAVVTDTLPAGLTFDTLSSDATCSAVGQTVTCGPLDLAVGDRDFTIVADLTPGVTGTVTNNVSVTSDVTDPNPGDESTSETTTILDPAVTIEKTVYVGHDAGASCEGGELVENVSGAAVTYCFAVTNPGDTYLALSLADTDLGITGADMTLGSGTLPLAPAATAVYYYETTVSGDLVNTASVTGNPVTAVGADLAGFGDVGGSDTAEVQLLAPSLTLDKTVYQGHDGGTSCAGSDVIVQSAAGPVTYCFVIENTGDTHLDLLTLTDPDLGINETNMTLVSGSYPLAPAASVVYQYETTAPVDLVNTATALANPVDGSGADLPGLSNVGDSDTAEVDVVAPSVAIAKTVYLGTDSGASCSGDEVATSTSGTAVTYCFAVTNTGDTHLDSVALDDPDLGITQADATLLSGVFPLAPTATAVWYFETTVSGDLVNTAGVTANPVDGAGSDLPGIGDVTDSDTATVDEVAPVVELEKTVYRGHDVGVSCPGSELASDVNGANITFCFVVTNTGDTNLDGVAIDDLDLGISEADMTLLAGSFPLAPAASATWYYETTVSGDLVNTAGVTANPVDGTGADLPGVGNVTDSDTAEVNEIAPDIRIDKTVFQGHDAGTSCPGGELATDVAAADVTYCFVVSNTGDTYLDSIAVTDAALGISDADMTLRSGTFPLAPAATATWFYETTIAGDLLNTADVDANPTDAFGTDIGGLPDVSDSDTAAVDQVAPDASVAKTVYQGHDAGVSCPGGELVTDVSGAAVTYCFVVTNSGDTALDVALDDLDLGITDADMTIVSGAHPVPAAGQTVWYYESTIGGDLVNTVDLVANPVDGAGDDLPGLADVTDGDTAEIVEVGPAVMVAKTVYLGHDSGASCGGAELVTTLNAAAVTYCFEVTNTGDTHLDSISLADAPLGITEGDMTLLSGTFPLAPAASAVWFYDANVAGDLLNTVDVSANPVDGAGTDLAGLSDVSDTDTAQVDEVAPGASLAKTVYQGHDAGASCAGGELVVDVNGAAITYCFLVDNTGDTALDVAMADGDLGITEAAMTLVAGVNPVPAGGQAMFAYEATVAGDLVNTADLTGNPVDGGGADLPGLPDVTDSDTAAVDEVAPAASISKTVYQGHDLGGSCSGGELVTDVAAAAVTYCFTVDNSGDTDLEAALDDLDLGITDAGMTLVAGANPVPAGTQAVWYFESTISGDLVNSVALTANPVDGAGSDLPGLSDVIDSDTAQVEEIAPAATIAKSVYQGHDSGASCQGIELVTDLSGAAVTYCFLVDNTGDTSLDVALTDAALGITDGAMTLLSGVNPVPAGTQAVWYYESALAGDLVNTADLVANPVDGAGADLPGVSDVTDSDTAAVNQVAPAASIDKTVYLGHDSGISCGGGELAVGSSGAPVTYCFVVDNTGDTDLDVAVNDAALGVTQAAMTLLSGANPVPAGTQAVWFYETTITGDLVNTGDLTANPVDGAGSDLPGLPDVVDSDTAEVDEVAPAGTVSKTVYLGYDAGSSCPGGELAQNLNGSSVTYCFRVQNTGDTALDVSLIDGDLGITDADMTLALGTNPVPAGALAVWYYESTIAGDLVNTVDLAANPVDGTGADLPGLADVSDSDTAEVDEVAPAASINKTVYQGHDGGASCAGGELVTDVAGAAVTYCFVVNNAGDTALDVSIADTDLGISEAAMSLISGANPVPAGTQATWFYETTISGDLVNTADLVANPVDGSGVDLPGLGDVTDSDTAQVDEVGPSIDLAKTVYLGHDGGLSCQGAELVAGVPAAAVTYCFVVTNTGDTHLGSITVDDLDLGITDADMTLLAGTFPLAPSASATWYFDGSITADLVNTAAASANPVTSGGSDLGGLPDVMDSDTAEVQQYAPAATIGKTVYQGHDGGASCGGTELVTDVSGAPVTYCFAIDNTGDTALDVALTDAALGITDADMTLVSGINPVPAGFAAVWIYETTMSGDLLNTADLTANPVDGAGADIPGLSDVTDSDTAEVDQIAPAAVINKTVYQGHDGGTSCPGGELVTDVSAAPITYCFVVDNSGDTDLAFAIDDAVLGITDADMTVLSGTNPVPAGGQTVFYLETTVNGDVVNTAVLTANPVDGGGADLPGIADVVDSDTASVDGIGPAVTVTKSAYVGHDGGASCAGSQAVVTLDGAAITYCFVVENTGDTDLDTIAIDDPALGVTLGDLTQISGAIPVTPGNTQTYIYETTVAGDLVNTATVTANPVDASGNDLPGLPLMVDDDTMQVDTVAPAATIAKTVYRGHDGGASCSGSELVTSTAGTAVTYCFVVDNTGDTDLDVAISDGDLGIGMGALTQAAGGNPVPAGGSATWYYEAALASDLVNTADLVANPVDGSGADLAGIPDVLDSDTAEVDLVAPSVTIDKTVYVGHDGGASCPGSELVTQLAGSSITYCFLITNTGDTHLAGITLNDVAIGITESDLTLVSGGIPVAPGGTVGYVYETTISGDLVNTADVAANPVTSSGSDLPGVSDVMDSDTAEVAAAPPATVGDRVWLDLDADGIQDGGEPDIPGVTVNLYAADGTTLLAMAVTDAAGSYQFPNLLPGTEYVIEVVAPAGAAFTVAGSGADGVDSDVAPSTGRVTVTPGSGVNLDVGDAGLLPASIGDYLWLDLDADGRQDGSEAGLADVVVNLFAADGTTLLSSTATNGAGTYLFEGLLPGDYVVEVVAPAGAVFSPQNVGTEPANSDVDPASGRAAVAASSGLNGDHGDAGLLPGSLAGVVFTDIDGSGSQDGGETGITGVTVELRDGSGAVVATTTTNGSGAYRFDGLPPGDYTVMVDPATLPGAPRQTADPDATLDDETTVALALSENVAGLDFGYQPTQDVSGSVFFDVAGDGGIDARDPSLAGVTVMLRDAGGVVAATAVTDAAGEFLFEDVPPGGYTVAIDLGTLPPGLDLETLDPDGTLDDATPVVVTPAAGVSGLDFAYTGTGTAAGLVWQDIDADGVQDPGEPGFGGIPAVITWSGPDGIAGTSDDVVYSAVTASNGTFAFGGLPAGDYVVAIEESALPQGHQNTFATAPDFTLAVDEDVTGLDYGYRPVVDLTLTIVPDLTVVQDGDQVVWTVVGSNKGPAADPGPIVITMDIPPELEFVSILDPDWEVVVAGSRVTATYRGVLGVGVSLDFPMLTVVLDAADEITIPASILGAGLDINAGNNADVAAIGTLPVTGQETAVFFRWGVVLVFLGAVLLLLVGWGRRHQEYET